MKQKLLGQLVGMEFGYNKCLVAPSNKTTFLVNDTDLTTRVSRNITLKIPIVSASMDTVTEHEMAIALALLGGIGVIHYNFGPNLEENIAKQLAQVQLVKRYENGFVEDPITLSPEHLVDDAAGIRKERNYSTIPITENGQPNGRLVGLITKDDYSMRLHAGMKIRERMITQLVTATWEQLQRSGKAPLDVANALLLDSHKSVLPVVDNEGQLMYLVTRSDVEKSESYPYATKDSNGRLRVLAAVEVIRDRAIPRMEALAPYVDGFVIDTAHGYFDKECLLIQEAKKNPKLEGKDIIGGNVVWPDAVKDLIDAGADGIRIGNGPGKGCKTWDNVGTGREQVSAIADCANFLRTYKPGEGVYLSADGGIEHPGDITIGIAAGGHTVTLGSMLAGTNEAPGEFETRQGARVKKYRGMGSIEAMQQGGVWRYSDSGVPTKVPEGGVTFVEARGSVLQWIPYLAQALRKGMFNAGCRTVQEMHDNAQLIYADKQEKREGQNFVG
jgi:IMP dehydrogenase